MESLTAQQVWTILSIVLPGLFTLVGAFLGSWFAFLFQEAREKKKDEAIHITAINKVQINFVQQLNALLILYKDWIVPFIEVKKKYGDNLFASFSFPALPTRDYSTLKVDGGSLVFLADYGKSNLITDILIAEEGFKELMILVNLRSETHSSQLQTKLEACGFVQGELPPMPEQEFKKYLGLPLLIKMKGFSDGIEQQTIKAIDEHKNILQRLHSAGKEIFPDAKAILSYKIKDLAQKDVSP